MDTGQFALVRPNAKKTDSEGAISRPIARQARIIRKSITICRLIIGQSIATKTVIIADFCHSILSIKSLPPIKRWQTRCPPWDEKAMRSSMLISRVRTLVGTVFLAAGGLLIPTVYAHADIYNYVFSSSFYNVSIIGNFQANPLGINTTTTNFTNFTGMGTFGISNISVNSGSGMTFLNTAGVLLNTTISNSGLPASFNTAGVISGNGSSFSFGTDVFGLFSATLAPSSGGGGSGGGSGGAPSPEVNAGLGMLPAGGTFVFLRRKRGSRRAALAA